jgi:hypothetical protein
VPGAPDPIAWVEDRLAGPAAFMLLDLDLALLRELLAGNSPASPSGALDLEGLLGGWIGLGETGADAEIERALLALSGEPAAPRIAVALLGRFDRAGIESALHSGAFPGLRVADAADSGVLQLDHLDVETCRTTRWAVELRPERVVASNDASLEPLLARLEGPLPQRASRSALAGLWRDEPFLTLQLDSPRALLAQRGDAGAAGLLRALLGELGDVGTVRLRASARGRRGVGVEAELIARDAAAAGALARRWRQARERDEREPGQVLLPALESWSDALELAQDGAALHALAHRGADAVAQLAPALDELLILGARQFAAGAAAHPAGDPAPHAGSSEPWTTTFRESYALEILPPYRPDAPLAGPVDAIAGPFGIRIEKVRRDDEPRSPLSLTLRAAGPAMPNLAGRAAAPRLIVERVSDSGGASLLAPTRCGPERAERAEPLLRSSPADVVQAFKTVHLRPEASIAGVGELAGRIEVDVPVRTQRMQLPAPSPGATLAGPGVEVEIVAAGPRGFAYRAAGELRNLLQVRGIASSGQPLASSECRETQLRVGGGRVGACRYSDELATVEAIFALERRSAAYPFALRSARPGTAGESSRVESSSYVPYSLAQYRREFGGRSAEPGPLAGRFSAIARAGPFRVGLSEIEQDGVLAPQLTVIAPDIPNLSYHATGLELGLSRIGLRDGRALRPPDGAAPPWRAFVPASRRRGELGLEGTARIATGIARSSLEPSGELARLEGEVVLRLASAVRYLEFESPEPGAVVSADGVQLRLAELSRDGFVLRLTGPPERLFSARAFSAAGTELAVEETGVPASATAGARELHFRVLGQPARLGVQLASGLAAQHHAYRIELAAPLAAASAR